MRIKEFDTIVCKDCGYNTNNVFCESCGSIVSYKSMNSAKSKDLLKKYEGELKKMFSNSGNVETITWNRQVNEYVQRINSLVPILNQEEFRTESAKSILSRIERFNEQCKTPEFQIAFIGTIKAGKSTLINALLGRNIASTNITPETATLTKFRHCAKGNYVRVEFYTSMEWSALWKSISSKADVFKKEYADLNAESEKAKWINHKTILTYVSDDELQGEIEKWTSSKHPQHYFVKEVEVGLQDFDMPEQVVFVDTPGLDDPVAYRSDVTQKYIRRANAVMACVLISTLQGSELKILSGVFSNTKSHPEKVFVVGTQLDKLPRPNTNWEEKQKPEWIKYLSIPGYYGNSRLAEDNVLGVSAYLMNCAREYNSLDEDERYDFETAIRPFRIDIHNIPAQIETIKDTSNVYTINKRIRNDLVPKSEKYIVDDIKASYMDVVNVVRQYFEEQILTNNKTLETASQDVQQIQEKYDVAKKNYDDIQSHKKTLQSTLKLLKDNTTKSVNDICDQLTGMVK